MSAEELKKELNAAKEAFKKSQKGVKRPKSSAKSRKTKEKRVQDKYTNVIYVGHLPPGFEEEALRKFFIQFGKILHLRVSRSVKTGRSRGYAFVEFEHPQIARAAAYALNDYILFGKTLKVNQLKKSELNNNIFSHSLRRVNKNRLSKSSSRYRKKRNNSLLHSKSGVQKKRARRSDERRVKALARCGIKYTPPKRE